jgi:ferredoxin-NADP reductase
MAAVDGDWLTARVSGIAQIAQGVMLLTVEDVGGRPLPRWEPGAHVEFRLPSGLTRQYSLCGDLADENSYSVAVLRDAVGRDGSAAIHAEARLGTELEIRPPRNHFPLVPAADYLLIAGGIGITPIKAMAEQLQRRGERWRLVYGGRRLESMPFADELVALGGDRVRLVPEDTDGRPDIADLISSAGEATHIYCCGPAGLLDAVTQACTCRRMGDRLHIERFTVSTTDAAAEGEDTAFQVELRASAVTLDVAVGQSILEVVRSVRPDIGFSCQEGYCGSCETRVLEGEPDHRGTLMSPADHDEEGTMLICVGRSRTPRLVLDL